MALSEMMKHYNSVKEKYSDCVVFYRLGDFYEMFFDDAKKVSKMLDLTLTGRDCGLKERAPMCGIPYHAADGYIAKLVELGEKVAICEQLTDPSESKGLVERDVIRVVTAGTVTENEYIDDKTNNFAMSVAFENNKYAIAWADITTGDFYVKDLTEYPNSEAKLFDEIVRINPSEIICDSKLKSISENFSIVKHKICAKFDLHSDYAFKVSQAEKTVKNFFGVINLSCFMIEDKPLSISACGSLLDYLSSTQRHDFKNITKINFVDNFEYMSLDQNAIRNLELTKSMRDGKRYGTLLWVLDKTCTPMGSRKLNSWVLSPLQSAEKINYRLDGLTEIFNNPLTRNGLIETLSDIRDTERICGKIANNNVNPRDLNSLATSLTAFPNVKFQLSGLQSQILTDIFNAIGDFSEVTNILNHAIVNNAPTSVKDGGFIAEGFDPEVDRLNNVSKNSERLLREMEANEREKTGIKNLKISYNKVFGYYIEVSNSFKNLVPYNYVRKQTLVNGERYITEELKKLEEDILGSKDKLIRLEIEIFNKIKEMLLQNIENIQISSKAVATLDCLLSLATVAKSNNYVRPIIKNSGEALNLVGGRHPVVETVSGEMFIANGTYLDSSERMMIITGPNMAGKSTYMRQVALISIMAHIGSFVPCKSAEIPIIDKIFTRVGASDNLILNQSTFLVEMSEVASIVNNATENSLIILDEVGRGTSTFDGLSIAWALVEHLASKVKAKTLFATHYHELSELEGKLEGVKNYKITVKESDGKIIFLRKIVLGSANKSFGIEVASLAGVPNSITSRAKSILKQLEKSDLSKFNDNIQDFEEDSIEYTSAVEERIKALDLNNISPMDAFKILCELKDEIE